MIYASNRAETSQIDAQECPASICAVTAPAGAAGAVKSTFLAPPKISLLRSFFAFPHLGLFFFALIMPSICQVSRRACRPRGRVREGHEQPGQGRHLWPRASPFLSSAQRKKGWQTSTKTRPRPPQIEQRRLPNWPGTRHGAGLRATGIRPDPYEITWKCPCLLVPHAYEKNPACL